jgi:predicted transposase YbfD/YdcC
VVPFTPAAGGKTLVDLVAVARVEAWREAGGGTRHTVRHYALSRLMPAEEVLSVTRRHWSIENDLHWPLDVHFREDHDRTRKDNGPAILAMIRRLALNIARAHPEKASLNLKRQRAAWDETFFIEMMTHMR